ncbi:MAG TPA: enoyl-CoA hydratase-related protein [Acidimicrobiales bacterium]|nr:enoyl-CoA hydratase-related protein [Acidimicrobiales bacterium]
MTETGTTGTVRVERRGGFAVVVLDDPGRRNALSLEMASELTEAVSVLEESGEVRAFVVTGAPPAFCAGADLAQLGSADETRLRAIYAGFERVVRSPLLTVAAVNGPAVGAGINLALACDVRLAAESARFDTRFLALGLHPGGGHSWMLERAVSHSEAVAMLFGGEAVSGAEAERIGLAHRCVADDELAETAEAFVATAAAAPPELVARMKATLSLARRSSYDEALEHEVSEQLWSIGQPAFAERLAALRSKISSSGR